MKLALQEGEWTVPLTRPRGRVRCREGRALPELVLREGATIVRGAFGPRTITLRGPVVADIDRGFDTPKEEMEEGPAWIIVTLAYGAQQAKICWATSPTLEWEGWKLRWVEANGAGIPLEGMDLQEVFGLLGALAEVNPPSPAPVDLYEEVPEE